MIVDDDEFIAAIMTAGFEPGGGFRAVSCRSGREMWRIMERQLPDIIVMDLFLPDTTGIDVIRNLKANPRYHHIPVIVLSGSDEAEKRAAALAAGASAYYIKPLYPSRLKQIISQMMQPLHSDEIPPGFPNTGKRGLHAP